MSLTEKIISNKDYTWQLRAKNYRCTFTSKTIIEAFKRMVRTASDRKQIVTLYLLYDSGWLEWSNSSIYLPEKRSKNGKKSSNATVNV